MVFFSRNDESGNIFCILSAVKSELNDDELFGFCFNEVKRCLSYDEALNVIRDYVELIEVI